MNTNNTVKPNGQPLINKIVDLYRLLEPFGIRPQNHRTGPHKDKVAKGYNQKDFEQSWESHLPETRGTAALGCESSDVAADLQDLSDLSKDISGQQLAASSQKRLSSGVAAGSSANGGHRKLAFCSVPNG